MKRKLFIIGLIFCLVFAPQIVTKVDTAVRTRLVHNRMNRVIKTIGEFQGVEPWRACSTCPYEMEGKYGWFIWDWAYIETQTTTILSILVNYRPPIELGSEMADSFYFYPGLRKFNKVVAENFPNTMLYYLVSGPNMGPMVIMGKKYPVVPSDYIVFKFTPNQYRWGELTRLGWDEVLSENLVLTMTLFTGPQVHRGFQPKQVILLPWHQRLDWPRIWGAFQGWLRDGVF